MAKKVIKITSNGVDLFQEIINELNLDEKELTEEIDATGKLIVEDMKVIINDSKFRPQAGEPTDLENAIELDVLGPGSYGVGDVEKLKRETPYWAALNWGSSHMVGKHMPTGKFSPGEPLPNADNFRDGRFFKGAGGKSPIVTKPIPAINYIERTFNSLLNLISQIKLRGK